MSEEIFDLIVIGAGPGGYVAAIRASQLGLRVAVVEQRSTLGGVCLNEGCIPSKALLDSSEYFSLARDKFSSHGIEISPPLLNLPRMMARKEAVVKKLTDGIAYLFKKHRITRLHGAAKIVLAGTIGRHAVAVMTEEATSLIEGKRILLATGSLPVAIPALPFDGERVVDAKGALAVAAVPQHLVVIGAGYIGLELGSVWRRLGAEVTVVEMLPKLLPAADRKVADTLMRSLKKQGLNFRMETRVVGADIGAGSIELQLEAGEGTETLRCDQVLVAAGRRPNLPAIDPGGAQLARDASGRVQVDANFETSIPGIFALGDLIPGPMLAHKASEEGVVFAERLLRHDVQVRYELIPGVVYTWPEAASVGKNEEALQQEAIPYAVGTFNFLGNGRACCMDETEGFVKVLAHQASGKVLGVHIVGPRASELIAEAVAVMSHAGTAQQLAAMFHAHPTLAEALKEAALAVNQAAIHA